MKLGSITNFERFQDFTFHIRLDFEFNQLLAHFSHLSQRVQPYKMV